MHLQENTLFDLGVKVTCNVAQYPVRHVTYSSTKFEVTTFNGLEGNNLSQNAKISSPCVPNATYLKRATRPQRKKTNTRVSQK